MSSRPKVLSSTTPSNASTPPLRAKASLSSVAKVRRAPSPRPSPPATTSVTNGPAHVVNPSKRPVSSQGRPVASLSPTTLEPPFNSSPVSPSFSRQRTPSVSLVSATSSAPVKVKAKVSSLAKPQPPQSASSTPPSLQSRPGLHTRSNSIVGLRPPASLPPPVPSALPRPKVTSPPTSPTRPGPPIVNTFPPTPTKTLEGARNSPPSSVISSQSSKSVDSGYGSIPRSVARVLPFSQSPEDEEDAVSRSGTTPVPLHTPIRQPNAFLSSPPICSPNDESDAHNSNLASPTHERKGSLMTEEEVELRAEARTNRKIADLEIQTASLQQLTASLERERHKQSLEIRELRRKLRESRLALPPRTFQSLKPTWETDDLNLEDEEEEEEEEENEDPIWDRLKGLVDGMLNLGRRAVEESQEFIDKSAMSGAGVVRVLTAGEVEELQHQSDDQDSDEDADTGADEEPSTQEGRTSLTDRTPSSLEDDHNESPG